METLYTCPKTEKHTMKLTIGGGVNNSSCEGIALFEVLGVFGEFFICIFERSINLRYAMFLGAPGLFVIDLNAHFALYIAFNVSRTIRRLIMEFGGDFRCHSGLSCLRMASSVNRNSTLMII